MTSAAPACRLAAWHCLHARPLCLSGLLLRIKLKSVVFYCRTQPLPVCSNAKFLTVTLQVLYNEINHLSPIDSIQWFTWDESSELTLRVDLNCWLIYSPDVRFFNVAVHSLRTLNNSLVSLQLGTAAQNASGEQYWIRHLPRTQLIYYS